MAPPDRFILDSKTEKFLASVKPAKLEDQPEALRAKERGVGLRLLDRGEYGEAETCLRRACREATERGNIEEMSQCKLNLARTLARRQPLESLALLRDIHEKQTADRSRFQLQNLLGNLFYSMCLNDLAAANREALLHTCAVVGDKRSSAVARANHATMLFEFGDTEEAMRLNEISHRDFADLGDWTGLSMMRVNMAVQTLLSGHVDPAKEHIDECRRMLAHTRNLYLRATVEITVGEIELTSGDCEEAERFFAAAAASAKEASLPVEHGRALIWRSFLREDTNPQEQLQDVVLASEDIVSRRMGVEGGLGLIMAGCWARTRGLPGEPYLERGHALLGGGPGADLRIAHYMRLMEAISRPKQRRSRQPFPAFLTQAPEIMKLKGQLKRLVDTDVRVLLEGESGTGKSFLARQLHAEGKRKRSAFVTVDCTNLEESLFESKLFGHLRGAFTGAVSDHVGLVEQANNGTLFLDEIGEVPVEIQAKLLYTIEEQRYRPVGGKVEKQAEFRVIAATNRCIDEMLDCGALRQDLFFRLAGYRAVLPPLRERPEDIGPLVEHRLSELNERYNRRKVIQPAAWSAVAEHAWPGNVRELNAVLERGFHLAHGRRVGVDDLGLGLSASSLDTLDLSWYTVRRAHLLRVLRLCRGNVSRAAKLLGLNRTTLIYKLKLLDIERSQFDPRLEESEAESPSLHLIADGSDPAAPV